MGGSGGREESQEVKPNMPTAWLPSRAPLSWKGLMAPSSVCSQNWNSSEALLHCFAMTGSHAVLTHWAGCRLHGNSSPSPSCPAAGPFVAHRCQARCGCGSEHSSLFPQFFTTTLLSPIVFLLRCNSRAIKPTLLNELQFHEFR